MSGGEQRGVLGPGAIFHGYRITRAVGTGGMGTVYEGYHDLLERRVAIKVLHARSAERADARTRFVREAQTVAKIRHRHVVEIYDVGLFEEQPYIVMEYLEGEPFDYALMRARKLDTRRAVNVLLPIAAALLAVHRAGLVHRDVKPENVFLAEDARKRIVPKLIDFGIAKDLSTPIAGAHHTVVGTPHFMSPEQARGSLAMDARTDQYAFGVMLYQATTGVMPFDADSLLDLMRLIDEGKPRHPLEIAPDIDPGLAEATIRAMARNAEDRFPSMHELGVAIMPYASEKVRSKYYADFGLEGDEDLDIVDASSSTEMLPPRFSTSTPTLDRYFGSFDTPGAKDEPETSTTRSTPALEPGSGATRTRRAALAATAVGLLVGAGFYAVSRPSGAERPDRAVAGAQGIAGSPPPTAAIDAGQPPVEAALHPADGSPAVGATVTDGPLGAPAADAAVGRDAPRRSEPRRTAPAARPPAPASSTGAPSIRLVR